MIPWFQFSSVTLGPVTIQVWGFFVALGMLVGMWLLNKLALKHKLNPAPLRDIGFAMIIGGLLGARLGHVVLYEPAYFLAHPLDILKVWQGGMSSYGSFVGAIVAFFWGAKKYHLEKKLWPQVADLLVWPSVIGWAIGRLGCLAIHDHLGAHSTCPLALMTPTGPRLEMTLLELLGLIPLVLGLFLTRQRTWTPGTRLVIMAVYYSVLRFVLDFYRATDLAISDTRYAGLTPAQYLGIIVAAWGTYWLLKHRPQTP